MDDTSLCKAAMMVESGYFSIDTARGSRAALGEATVSAGEVWARKTGGRELTTAEDLDAMSEVEAYLTEIKAAAVAVVTRRGSEEGKPIFYCDNDPVGEGLDARLVGLAREAVAQKSS